MKKIQKILLLIIVLCSLVPAYVCMADVETKEAVAAVDHGALHQDVIDGKKYFIYDDGVHLTGWFDLTNTWSLYLDPNDNGAAVTGYQSIDGKEYIFDSNGLVNQTYGTPIIDGHKYWVTGDGSIRTGWQVLGNWRLYFDPTLKYALTGIQEVEGKHFLFNSDGVSIALSGTPVYDGKKYWFNSDGSLGSGWLNLTNWRMYFDPSTYVASTGLATIDEKKYLFNQDGVCYINSRTAIEDGKKYWFNSDGSLAIGWQTLGNWRMYYWPDECYAATGWQVIDGQTYYFDGNGVLRQDRTDAIAGKTTQIIDVAIPNGSSGNTSGTLTVYNLDNNAWSPILSSSCYVGRNGITADKWEGDGKTPMGIYTLSHAFGIMPDPGSTRSYLQVNSNHYWVGDSNSSYYNQLVDISQIGTPFNTASSEHLIDYTTAYRYSINIDSNASNTPRRGSAIFLHCGTGRPTAGCVSVPEAQMITILRSLRSDTLICIRDAD